MFNTWLFHNFKFMVIGTFRIKSDSSLKAFVGKGFKRYCFERLFFGLVVGISKGVGNSDLL